MTQPRPFHRLRFEDLPQTPRVPHPYHSARGASIGVDSRPFGRIETHYRVHGVGPPLLLVHGLMTSSYSWRYMLEPLGRRFTLYVPDLPGAGRTEAKSDHPHGPEALAEWLGEFMATVGIRGCPVIGNSMGGYLCMRLALRDPGSMSRLVNLHSPGLPEARLWALRAALSLPGMRALLAGWVRGRAERWAHANVHYYDETLKSREEAAEYGAPLKTAAGARCFVRYLHDTMDPRAMGPFRDALRERRDAGRGFPVPLLLLYAETDPMVPPRIGRAFAELIPDARLVWLREASHFAHVDAPERFLVPTLEFLGAAALDRTGG